MVSRSFPPPVLLENEKIHGVALAKRVVRLPRPLGNGEHSLYGYYQGAQVYIKLPFFNDDVGGDGTYTPLLLFKKEKKKISPRSPHWWDPKLTLFFFS